MKITRDTKLIRLQIVFLINVFCAMVFSLFCFLPLGTVCEVPSCELVAGDIVVLKDQESIPADILVLACSDSDGTCYVDTSSLDGETK